MEFFVALILFGQVAGDENTGFSPTISDRFSQRSATLGDEPSVGDGPSLPSLESFPRAPASSVDPQEPETPQFGTPAAARSFSPDVVQAAATSSPRATQTDAQSQASSEASRYATELLTTLLAADEKQTSVRKLKLVDILSRIPEGQQQANAIGAYWDLAMAVARLGYAEDKLRTVQTLPAPNAPADQALIASATATADANEAAARDDLLTAQFRLLRVAGMAWDGQLPWPADVPLAGPYRTNFDTFFAQRTAPLEIRHIHMSLPGKLRWIERSVLAIGAAESAADMMLEAYKQGRAPAVQLIQSLDRLESSQHAFLAAIVDYNGRIAEYSIAAVGPTIGPEKLVTTLIRPTQPAGNLVSVPRDVRTPANQAPALRSGPPGVQR